MSTAHSAALLAYQVRDGALQVFLAHMGGPFWAHRDDGAWSIPKGEYDPAAEDPLDVARREFGEEIGIDPPDGPALDLGTCTQPSGKRIRTFAVAAEEDLRFVSSNTFPLEWPRRSGVIREFPEVDRAAWFGIAEAERKVVPGQVPILRRLGEDLAGG